jgi:hypothetical protein
MTNILLLIFAVVCAGLLIWGMREKGRIYEFPFLAGATWTGFVLLQLIGLRHNEDLPENALNRTIIMAILCAAMCWLGYQWNCRPLRRFNWPLDDDKLLWAGAVLTLAGAWFFYKISRLSEDLTEVSMWTGLPVAYTFFASVLSYGFALAALVWARQKSRRAWGTAIFGSLFYLDRIFLAGRRGVTLEFAFIILLSIWFTQRRCLPRAVMLAGVFCGTLALHSTGDYRAVALSEGPSKWRQLQEIPLVENLKHEFQEGGSEVENAAYEMAVTARTARFDYGVFHWNTLVFNYVPAQLFGDEFKQSLLLPVEGPDSYTLFGHITLPGCTATGLSDAFGSFWYFGCLKFFFIAFVLRKIYLAAVQGRFIAQVFYMLIITDALHTITHHTQWFISPWVHMGIFLLPCLYLARTRVFRFLPPLTAQPASNPVSS